MPSGRHDSIVKVRFIGTNLNADSKAVTLCNQHLFNHNAKKLSIASLAI